MATSLHSSMTEKDPSHIAGRTFRALPAQGCREDKDEGVARLLLGQTHRAGHYEIRSVPPMLGEHSVPGGVMPKEGFEEHYEKVNPS